MATRARKAKVLLIDDRIDILNRDVAETFPANQAFRAVNGILALVRVGACSASICKQSLIH